MSDYFIGEIRLFGFNYAPQHWALCQGQTLTISQNSALYSLLGIQFGGDGKTVFKLPDLQGRVPLGSGRSPISGTVYQQGVSYAGGTETVALQSSQMPTHTHTLNALSAQGSAPAPTDGIVSTVKQTGTPPASPPIYGTYGGGSALQALNTGTVSSVGSGAAHANMQPYSVTNFCIALAGIYPARN